MPQDLEFSVRPKHSGLLNVVALWAGFEQLAPGAEERAPRFMIALRSSLPPAPSCYLSAGARLPPHTRCPLACAVPPICSAGRSPNG